MSIGGSSDAENEEQGDIFIDDSDILQEINIDEEELPDADEPQASDDEDIEEADDSIHVFTGHSGEVYAVACSPTDTTLVATGGGDDKGFMWRVGRGDRAFELQGHSDSINSLAFSMDGLLLASGSFDGTVHVWDVASQSLKHTLDGPGAGIEWMKWHPRGHLVLAGSEDKSVWMWNADKGIYLNLFTGHASTVTCGDFTPDGKTICTGSDDASFRIWNPTTGESIHVVEGHLYHTDGLTCMSISPDSTVALTGSKDSTVNMVNIQSGRILRSLTAHTDSVECVGFSPNFSPSEPWAATGSMDQKLIIWNLTHPDPRNTFIHEGGVTCLAWIGKTRFIATGCADGKVRVWDTLSNSETAVKTLSGHSDVIQAISVSSNGDFLVSVAMDGTSRVFEIDEFK